MKRVRLIAELRARPERAFFAALWGAAPGYASAWWLLVVFRGVLPAIVSIAFGWLVSGVTRGVSLTRPLMLVGVAFTLSLILQPFHQLVSSNVGSRLAPTSTTG